MLLSFKTNIGNSLSSTPSQICFLYHNKERNFCLKTYFLIVVQYSFLSPTNLLHASKYRILLELYYSWLQFHSCSIYVYALFLLFVWMYYIMQLFGGDSSRGFFKNQSLCLYCSFVVKPFFLMKRTSRYRQNLNLGSLQKLQETLLIKLTNTHS